ncbi:MAG: nucleotide exchange factor GrpE [Bdellovibrionota bacterium]
MTDTTNPQDLEKKSANGEAADKTVAENSSDTPSSIEERLASYEAELKEHKNKYVYLYAEFETYKNRVQRERADLLKFGCENLIRELLQVGDNLERALAYTENVEALVTGLKMVNQQLQDTLGKYGVKPVNASGEKFDPQFHEAVAQEPVSNGHEPGNIVREHQKGYTLHGRLLRPARVVVATK